MLRRVLAAVGVLLVAVGVVVAAVPSVTEVVRLPDVPTVVVAGVAVVLALSAHAARKRVEFRDPEEASVRATGLEDRFDPPRPGADIDAEIVAGPRADDAGDTPVRERLRLLAVRVLTDSENWTEEEAHQHLDDGTWTDDRTAAALFSEEVTPPAQDVVASLAGIETAHEREVRHALAELERRSNLGVEGGD